MLTIETRGAEAAPGDKLYWSDPVAGKIQRSDLDGSNIEDVLTGLASPRDLEVDQAAGKLYWISDLGIRRANFDGTGAEDVVPGISPTRFALDPVRAKVYWTELTADRIRRANYDGTNVQDVVTSVGGSGPYGIAIDAANSFLYWSDGAVVTQSDLDGNGAVTAGTPTWWYLLDVALSPTLSLVWTEDEPSMIPEFCKSAFIGGPGGIVAFADQPADLVVGSEGIYWADNTRSCATPPDQGEPRIRRTSSGGTVDLVTGLSSTGGVAIVNFPPPTPTITPTPTDTPTPTPTPCLGGSCLGEMILNVSGGVCDDANRPTTCGVLVGAKFTLVVEILEYPIPGYVGAQSFIHFGDDLTYNPSTLVEDEIVWSDCEPATAVRAQITDDTAYQGCLTGLLPPLPVSVYIGEFLHLSMTCSSAETTTDLLLLPYDDVPGATIQFTSGSAFTTQSGASLTVVVPTVGGLRINCVAPPPAPVGGIALGADLRPLPLKTSQLSSPPWILVGFAVAAGAVALGGAAWYARQHSR